MSAADSVPCILGVEVGAPPSILICVVMEGGSMTEESDVECDFEGTAGPGKAGIEPSFDEVSMVICFVSYFPGRSSYRTGEHLTATEGFL